MLLLFLLSFLFLANAATEEWQAPVINADFKIGTPSQSLTLQVDPNFVDIFVIGEQCKSLGCYNQDLNRKTYTVSKSSTAKDTNVTLKTKFGRSIVNGKYINDVVSLDGINSAHLDVGVLSSSDVDFHNIPVDGVLGLSLKNYYRSEKQLNPVVKSLLASSDKQWVNVWINKVTSNKNRTGHVTFGAPSSKYCKGNPQFYPDSFDYQFNVEKVRFGPIVSHRTLDSKVDFRQQYILVPSVEYQQILNILSASATANIACSKIKNINLEIKIGGTYYVLNYTDYSQQVDSTYCKLLLKDNGDYQQGGNGFVLGEPFLRNTCVTFDVATKAIGFSPSSTQ